MRKLPAKSAHVLVPMFTSLITSGIATSFSLVRGLGFNAAALHKWPTTWLMAWLIVFPVMLVALPLVRRLVSKMVES